MRNKALRAIIYFFLLMAALTLVSRAADNLTLAKVDVSRVGSGALTHETLTEGQVTAAEIIPLWAASDLRVKDVIFKAGESALKGDKLVYYDREGVIAAIDQQKLALKKLESEESSTTEIDMQADMLIKQRTLDDAQKAADKAKGSKAKKETAQKLERTREDFEMAKKQWEGKILAENKRLEAVRSEIKSVNEKINELEVILKNGCALSCPFDATIVSVKIERGAITGTEACCYVADKNASLLLQVEISEEQAKYIKPSDKAQTLPAGRKDWLDANVESVSASSGGKSLATVALGDSPYSVGETVQVKFSKKTDSYRQCVPLSAIHGDSAGDYVLTVADTRSVLGDTQTLRRVSVTVLDKDQSRAAINASLTQDDKVVVKSDKSVDAGSRVRVNE